jgi:DNA-binding Lrp family transcriptional regulator
MVKAYILVKTELGKLDEIFRKMKNMNGIVSVASTAGEYDLILVVNVKSLEGLDELVTNTIHKIPGIISTVTHVVAKEESNA